MAALKTFHITTLGCAKNIVDSEAMEQLLAMGQEEGLTEAVGQIDAILAEDVASTGR